MIEGEGHVRDGAQAGEDFVEEGGFGVGDGVDGREEVGFHFVSWPRLSARLDDILEWFFLFFSLLVFLLLQISIHTVHEVR